MRTNAGYIITDSCRVGDGLEVVMGYNAKQSVTWLCKDSDNYYWGHYFDDPRAALKDYGKRIMEEAEY